MQNNFQGKDMQLCHTTQFHMPLHFIKNCDTISACRGMFTLMTSVSAQAIDGSIAAIFHM